jgi:hypothetical protein
MDPNVRLSKLDCPEVVDLLLHRKYRSSGMFVVFGQHETAAFSLFQLSKFLQYPGDAHLAAAYRVLAYTKPEYLSQLRSCSHQPRDAAWENVSYDSAESTVECHRMCYL